ncbi:hypothetical protein LS684_03455 [Cytobacillus spongiae]|uniref:hypothetical protein n=1 Tax=Cytobacillus spongiae TaxID=2901381 RepID=UPI001F2F8080|nr:hypothetical protein [Cytobacillus spongiae]UII56552.1 hypothetical protein LS684_03455 [Cytobacillus spongiae]
MNVPINVTPSMDVVNLITQTIDSTTNYLKAKEVEETERQRVIACLNAITKKMEVERRNFELYVKESFAEREKLYQRMDEVIHKGLETNDIEMIKIASNVMLNVYNKNPLEGYKDVSQGVQMNVLQPMRSLID